MGFINQQIQLGGRSFIWSLIQKNLKQKDTQRIYSIGTRDLEPLQKQHIQKHSKPQRITTKPLRNNVRLKNNHPARREQNKHAHIITFQL